MNRLQKMFDRLDTEYSIIVSKRSVVLHHGVVRLLGLESGDLVSVYSDMATGEVFIGKGEVTGFRLFRSGKRMLFHSTSICTMLMQQARKECPFSLLTEREVTEIEGKRLVSVLTLKAYSTSNK